MADRSLKSHDPDAADDDIVTTFGELVNMTPVKLEAWLASEESRSVGQKSTDDAESTGHRSGRRIVALLRTKRAELSDDDRHEMHRVVGYIKRHLAQRPAHSEHSRWAASLKNWGHDPTIS